MKAIVCEMCNSHDVIKDGDYFICQSCGTKYTTEAAKKLMVEVEGKVDVSGSTIKVDKSNELNNLYNIARRAKNENNSEKAARYYDMILQQDPESWEANFYTVYYSSMQTNIANIESAANRVSNVLPSTFEMIAKLPENEMITAADEITQKVMLMSSAMSSSAVNHYNDISTDIRAKYTAEANARINACANTCYLCGESIEKMLPASEAATKIRNKAFLHGVSTQNKIGTASDYVKTTMRAYKLKVAETDKAYYKQILPDLISELETNDRSLNNRKTEALKNTKKVRPGFLVIGLLFLVGGIAGCIYAFVLANQGNDSGIALVIGAGIGFMIGLILLALGLPNKKRRAESEQLANQIDLEITKNSAELAKLKNDLQSFNN